MCNPLGGIFEEISLISSQPQKNTKFLFFDQLWVVFGRRFN